MIIHRMSTQPPEPPVRFYKGIALTFLFLTVLLLGVVIYITSKKVTITVLTKQDPETITFSATAGTENGETAIGGSVATSDYPYSAEFTPTGNSQVEDVARGKVTLFNKTGATVALVKTTRLLSENDVLFRLTEAVSIPANGQIEAEVYADKKGSVSNIGPTKFTVPGLSLEKQKVVFAESSAPMTGGMKNVGSLSSDDIDNAKNEFRQKVQDAFEQTLPSVADGNERIVAIVSENILSDHSAGDVVSSFKIFGTSTLVAIEFSKNNLEKMIKSETETQVDEKFERYVSLTSNPKVVLQTYDSSNGTAVLNIRQEVAVMIDANSENLAATNFFGKSKDEIERYVMSLEHVAGVDVKFTPAWVSTAPAATDRVTIIVKDIK